MSRLRHYAPSEATDWGAITKVVLARENPMRVCDELGRVADNGWSMNALLL
jgi:hypothetical protein